MEQRKEGMPLLGFGCMRFPRKGTNIDLDAVEEMLRIAIDEGVNYLDTAYIYPGSEKALGTVLKKNGWRDRVNIATKLPHYLIHTSAGLDKMFNEQLSRLQTDHIDYYLMHMLPDVEVWEKLKKLGIEEWIREKKETGQIRKIGFSYHGNTANFKRLIDAYDWEFAMVQYNYMDENSQAGRRGVEYAHGKGIPVIVMEPLRGGRLTDAMLPEDAKKIFRTEGAKYSAPEWSFRWLWNQPEVTTILSGMNTVEMLKENIRVANSSPAGHFTEEDFALIEKVRNTINAKVKIGCTGCDYCQPCPKGVDIAGAFRNYNISYTDGYIAGVREYMMCTIFHAIQTNAGLCVNCGKCESHCPQNIQIRKELANVRKRLEFPGFGVAAKIAKKILK